MRMESDNPTAVDPAIGHGLTTKQSLLAVALVLGALLAVYPMVLGFQSAFPREPWPGEDAKPVGAVDGESLYKATCVACHGPTAKGVPGLGKDMTTSAFVSGLSDQDLLAFIIKGRSVDDPANTTKVPMPPKGGNAALTDEELLAIIKFVRAQ